MADDLTDESKRTPFPDGTVIEAGEFLQIELDKDGWPGFALGRRVRTLYSGEPLTAGLYRIPWNGRDDEGRPAASGVYLYQLIAGTDFTAVGRMALVR